MIHRVAVAVGQVVEKSTVIVGAVTLAGWAFGGCTHPHAPPEAKSTEAVFREVSEEAGLRGGNPGWGKGVSWVDFDGDGWEDLWLSDAASGYPEDSSESRLLRNNGDGTFTPVELPIPLEAMRVNWAGLWGDIDDDGDPDLFLVNGALAEPVVCTLWRNDFSTGGSLTEISASAGISRNPNRNWGASFADFDNDGDLDLFVTALVESSVSMNSGSPPLGAPPAPPSRLYLYRNDGTGHFDEVSAQLGFGAIAGNQRNPVFFDFDRDGDLDLYVAGMDDQRLFRNDGAAGFIDLTQSVFGPLGISSYTWAAAAADFDQDGWEDLYLGRWDAQDYVLRNRHDGTFEALGREIGLDMQLFPVTGENTMGLAVGDVNNDGFPDLLLGTGRPSEAVRPLVYCNEGRPLRFRRCSEPFYDANFARHHGIALSDFNHDGRMDVVYNNGGIPERPPLPSGLQREYPALFIGTGEAPAETAAVMLVGTRSSRDPIGATLEVGTGDDMRFTTVRSMDAFQSQNGPWQTLRVGSGRTPLTVRWPSGRISTATLVAGDRVVLTEPD